MKIDSQSISRGLEAALERTRERFGTSNTIPQDAPEVRRLTRVLQNWPGDADPRFVSLFVELFAVAQIARVANNEPMLTDEEIFAFLAHSSAFFNSFLHK